MFSIINKNLKIIKTITDNVKKEIKIIQEVASLITLIYSQIISKLMKNFKKIDGSNKT